MCFAQSGRADDGGGGGGLRLLLTCSFLACLAHPESSEVASLRRNSTEGVRVRLLSTGRALTGGKRLKQKSRRDHERHYGSLGRCSTLRIEE